MTLTEIMVVFHLVAEIVFVVRVMTRPHREPASRVAWVAVIAAIPLVGMLAYVLFGETSIGRRRIARMRETHARLPQPPTLATGKLPDSPASIPDNYRQLFQIGQSVNGFEPVGGNSGTLLADSNATIDAMIADIDAASEHVHLMFYIWLPDNNGLKMVEALKRATARGIQCRAMADDLGSRTMIRSIHWREMRAAGVNLAVALPIGNPLLRPLRGRLDLRNHRKLLIVDGQITYCGSQNCADPEFLVKAKFAPWVDTVIRFQGPIARQNQYLFASDWMSSTNEDISELLNVPLDAAQSGFPAQVIGTGPTNRYSAMPEVFESLFHGARRELILSTPYYIPDESMQDALCSAAWRGVDTTVLFPARNDSWIVGGASRSYYADLLEAGVKIHEYDGGLLHAKTLTLDGSIALIGSANMDRRSFDLNYENNILFHDLELAAALRQRQLEFLARSHAVTAAMVEAWPMYRRLWNNTLATLGPIL